MIIPSTTITSILTIIVSLWDPRRVQLTRLANMV
jgi:hypothetical protein